MISARSACRRVKLVDLVVDVGDVHNEMNVIAKVVLEDATEDILGDIVAKNCRCECCRVFRVIRPSPSMTHMRCIVDGWPTVVPFYECSIGWCEFVLR
jgi:hypothetical protein